VKQQLAVHLAQEYAAFMGRYAGVRREPEPDDAYLQTLPPAEQESVRQRQRDHIAREPFWGPYMERAWRSKLTELEQFLRKE
jgi:hypothetical protein